MADDDKCIYYFVFAKPNKVEVTVRLKLKGTDSVGDAIVQAAIAKGLIQQTDDTRVFLEGVEAKCGRWHLECEYFGDTLQETHTDMTPIKSTPILIKMPQVLRPMPPLRSVNAVLRREGTMEYLDYPNNLDEETEGNNDGYDEEGLLDTLQNQLRDRLRFASTRLGLGYTSPEQKQFWKRISIYWLTSSVLSKNSGINYFMSSFLSLHKVTRRAHY